MTGSLRILRGLALTIAIVLATASLIPILFYIPDSRNWIYRNTFSYFLPDNTSWRKFDAFTGTSCQIYRFHIPLPHEMDLMSDLTVFSVKPKVLRGMLEINGIMSRPQLSARKLSAKPIEFYEGKFDLELTGKKSKIRLNEWASKDIHFDAEIILGHGFKVESGFIRGLANQNELSNLLRGWKKLAPTEMNIKKKFYIEWSASHIDIMLDGKPFFKAGWKMAESK